MSDQDSDSECATARRARAVEGLLALREELRRRGVNINVAELVAESRRELERRGQREPGDQGSDAPPRRTPS